MKITIFELLGMVKDGKAPRKIKYEDIILDYDLEGQDYRIYQNGYLFAQLFERPDCKFLNDEVEILEEEKKIPEKLYLSDYEDTTGKFDYDVLLTINEIIDYLDYLKSKGE